MVAIKLDLLLFLNILYVIDCERRITNGRNVCADKPYVVYLVKAPDSERMYDEWLCGGALVSTTFIITSAACVADVEHMYAIAGYKKYVKDEDLETDRCTRKKKKKVVYTCVPMKYQLDYDQTEVWSFIDIALAKVESPYDLYDNSFKKLCSYLPALIPINYNSRCQKPGTDTLTYGWGHAELWRKESDENNYNEEILQFAASKIIDKTKCKKHYECYANMDEVIDQYMICTDGKGDLTDEGEHDREPCDDSTNENDHGGPLVTWIDGDEVLIGVASVFKVSADRKCMGPYLFTSTKCNGAFLDCILKKSNLPDNRRKQCNSPPIQRGYETVEKIISWSQHPAGPADNERDMAEAEGDGYGSSLRNSRAEQNLIRLSKLTKMAKDQSDTMLRQQKPILPSV